MAKDKDSPNADIDKAVKDLLKEASAENAAPEVIRAKASVINVAISWEKVKHHIKEDGDFDPNNI